MDKLIMAIATGFGLGYLPKAPGTWGTLLAFPIHLLMLNQPINTYLIVLGVLAVVAVFTAGSAEKILDHKDPGIVVIDEVVGMLIVLMGAPVSLVWWAVAFVLFRLFDVVKPFPIRLIDQRINGGVGILMDDVLAGVYALIVLKVIVHFIPVG